MITPRFMHSSDQIGEMLNKAYFGVKVALIYIAMLFAMGVYTYFK